MERRLVALLAADVVGYSRLMGKDEVGTHAALKRCEKEHQALHQFRHEAVVQFFHGIQ